MASRRLLPLLDRVLVKRFIPQTKTSGGILLPESQQSRVPEGTVIAVGPGRRENGQLIEPALKVGDRVLLPEFGGTAVKLDAEEVTLFREGDILGVFKDK